jgi:hypothetical protein
MEKVGLMSRREQIQARQSADCLHGDARKWNFNRLSPHPYGSSQRSPNTIKPHQSSAEKIQRVALPVKSRSSRPNALAGWTE